MVDEGGQPHLFVYASAFIASNPTLNVIIILQPRHHRRLVIVFFLHDWLVIRVSSLAAGIARTTCMVSLLFSPLLLQPLNLVIIKLLFLYLQRHILRISCHSLSHRYINELIISIRNVPSSLDAC